MLDLRGVGHRFGGRVALREVTLQLESDERLAVFGPNGAGKTTLLRILATLLSPSSGTVRLFGLDPRTHAATVRRRIGVVGHRTLLDDDLTAEENLRFYARLYDVANPRARIADVLTLVGVRGRRDRVGALSRGTQQRVALARAILHDPDLLLLDEPETGLDAAGIDALLAAVERSGRARALVVASHQPARAARLATRGIWLRDGRIVESGTLAPSGEMARPPLVAR